MQTSSFTWPRDALQTVPELPRQDQAHLICFLACPFQPRERADALAQYVQTACDAIGSSIGATIECVRGDQISKPSTIHTDIWRYIQLADALIFDVTGLNGNVLMELGVAAAVRPQSSVILLRDEEDQAEEGRFLFDLAPSRHLLYRRSIGGTRSFDRKLTEALLHALTPAPYIPPAYGKVSLPLVIDLHGHADPPQLLSPVSAHRRPSSEGLEFGSLFQFSNSWLSVGTDDYSTIKVKAKLRMTKRHPRFAPTDGWIGVSLCSTHFFANYSYLVYVKSGGALVYTEPQSETDYVDRSWGQLEGFDPFAAIEIAVSLTTDALEMAIGKRHHKVLVADMPYRRNAGKVRLQTHGCRA